jgi:hypothetical protein
MTFGTTLLLALALALLAAPLTAGTPYFPPDTFGQRKADWYSRCLDVMREPSLVRGPVTGWIEAYRFLWLRSFHEPVVARVELDADGSGVLTVKMLSGESRCQSTESLTRWSVTALTRAGHRVPGGARASGLLGPANFRREV